MQPEQFIIPAGDAPLSVYSEFVAQLSALREENSALVFDYESEKGNKEARSHIHKLRRTKGAVESARKEAKAASLEYGRRVDADAKSIIGQIEDMISVHERPLLEIEEREKARKQAILDRLGAILRFQEIGSGLPSKCYRDALSELDSLSVDESLEESMAAAVKHKKESAAHLSALLACAEKQEAEAAELAKLRAEAEARERAEREQRIAEEAAAKAKAEAEDKAKREAAAAAEREKAERARAEKAEAEAKAAIERAARAEKEAAERAAREVEEKARAEAEASAKREADRKHRAKINNAAVQALIESAGIDESSARAVIEAVAKRLIPSVTISY